MIIHFFKASIPPIGLYSFHPFLQNHPALFEEYIQCGKELNKFCSPNSSDDLCLLFCLYPSSMALTFMQIVVYFYSLITIAEHLVFSFFYLSSWNFFTCSTNLAYFLLVYNKYLNFQNGCWILSGFGCRFSLQLTIQNRQE